MPSRNAIKTYVENGWYHAYNRGVDKQEIFKDDQDYRVFLSLLKTLLLPGAKASSHPLNELTNFEPARLRTFKSLYGEVDLVCYCLMPNHFHLLLKQTTIKGMASLMRALGTLYSTYFNKKYYRQGTLFQGRYKAVLVDQENYLLHLTRYIHLNGVTRTVRIHEYPYSSYAYYLGTKNALWVKPDEILGYFKTARSTSLSDCLSYQSFVEDYKKDSGEILGDLIIEKD